MSVFVIGGTGFIGSHIVRLLAARGEQVVCMDINPNAASFSDLGQQVSVLRGDVTQFDDVVNALVGAKPSRVLNLSYFLQSGHPPHTATKLNIMGMDNCFEAARLCGINRVVYASSLAVNGLQKFYGDRAIKEDDYRYGVGQYASHKIFNEFQAQDYQDKYGMVITGIRPANVTGADKVRGSIDHVNCITEPARGNAITFKFRDAMRCPIHVDDTAEIFARVLMEDHPKHSIYNTGGAGVSLGDIADIVRGYIPDASITFTNDVGGRANSANYLIDNSRLVEEFGMQLRPFPQRVLQMINDTRAFKNQPPIAG